jgi:hypothetical protein
VRYNDYTNRGAVTLEGPASVIAANLIRERREQQTQWPYPWIYPPPEAIRVTAGADTSGSLLVPAAATPTQGLLYTVDEGFQFCLDRLVVEYIAAGQVGAWNPGDATWSITANQPVGVTSFQGYVVQGFSAVDVPLGSLQIPWPLEMPELFDAGDQVRVVFTNTNLAQGAGNTFKSILLGWRWPVR